MRQSGRFRIDDQRVVHETIEGETILINLLSGYYYSLGGCGAEVWHLLSAGHSGDEVVDQLQRRYGEDRDTVADPVHALIDQLVGEELLESAAENGHAAPANGSHAPDPGGSFVPPVLEKFSDLQYFLLVDPIHQSGPAGWPYERRADEAEDAA
jgi:hypothetical protein